MSVETKLPLTYRVVADSLNVRKTPSLTAEVLGHLTGGHLLSEGKMVEGDGRTWLRVTLEDGKTGWSSMKYIETTLHFEVVASALSVRSKPSIDADRVGYLRRGQIVPHGEIQLERLEDSPPRSWMSISGEVRGWASMKYLRTVSNSESSGAPPWLKIALREKDLGVREYPGERHNPRIQMYHSSTLGGRVADEIPWCSSFVNWCVEEAGLEGTDSAAARSWLKWGNRLQEPRSGCIVVFWRGQRDGWQGHVALYMGEGAEGGIKVLGGNQKDRVSIAEYSKSQLLGYRWPGDS